MTLLAASLLFAIVPGSMARLTGTAWIALVDAPLRFFGATVLLAGLMRQSVSLARFWGARRIYEPLVTGLSTALIVLVVHGIQSAIASPLSGWQMLSHLALALLYWQVVLSFVFLFQMPGLHQRARHTRNTKDLTSQGSRRISIGETSFDPKDIRHIESDDHYLVVHTADGSARVLERLSTVNTLLSEHGMLVHRSHWLSFAEFGKIAREGRRYCLVTRSGRSVPVSRNRFAAVSDALRQMMQAKP